MGRLHVSQTRAEPTIAEMELRKGGEYRWNSWACGCGLLSGANQIQRHPIMNATPGQDLNDVLQASARK